jgi:hypothetical protein
MQAVEYHVRLTRMGKYIISTAYICIVLMLAGCPDPPLYETPLPNGYTHHSNGREFGYILSPNGEILGHYNMLNNGKEQWCDNFAWQGQWVVCELYEYGERLTDEPRSLQYLLLDTTNNTIKLYDTKEQCSADWQIKTGSTLPALKRDFPSTKSYRVPFSEGSTK